MKGMTTYKVLWVDDDESIIDAFATLAEEEYDITLDVATNWEEAEEKLRTNFKEYSAIILDANCKLKESDAQPSELFLGQVSVRLARVFGEKHEFVPWYVLSAGTMKAFDVVMALINTEERQQMASIWGDVLYYKDSEKGDACDKLFERIKAVSADKTINKVLFRHADVFKWLGEDKVIDYVMARKYMLKMLSAMYNPEENLNYEYEGNPLRKVMEYVFRTANKYGLLPDECIDGNGRIVLLDASRFMGGLNVNCYNGRTVVHQIRFGEPGAGRDGAGGDSVFPKDIAMHVKNILDFSNSDSHTVADKPYVIEDDKKDVFFAFVLLLCQVIKCLGNYIAEHPNKESNQKLFKKIEVTNQNRRQ